MSRILIRTHVYLAAPAGACPDCDPDDYHLHPLRTTELALPFTWVERLLDALPYWAFRLVVRAVGCDTDEEEPFTRAQYE